MPRKVYSKKLKESIFKRLEFYLQPELQFSINFYLIVKYVKYPAGLNKRANNWSIQ